METDNLLGSATTERIRSVLWHETRRTMRKSCCCLLLLLVIVLICVLPAVLQAKPLASLFLSPSVDNYNFYIRNLNNETVCRTVIAPLLHPSSAGVTVLVGVVDIEEIQDYMETRSRIRMVNSLCKLERVYTCLTELYFGHSIAVHVETIDELDQYRGFHAKDIIYLQGNPFHEVVKIDYHRLHRAGYNDRERFSWEYFALWSAESRKFSQTRFQNPPVTLFQYNNLTLTVLNQLYELVIRGRTDVTPMDCAGEYKPLVHTPDLIQVTDHKRGIWCVDFKPSWNASVWGTCE